MNIKRRLELMEHKLRPGDFVPRFKVVLGLTMNRLRW